MLLSSFAADKVEFSLVLDSVVVRTVSSLVLVDGEVGEDVLLESFAAETVELVSAFGSTVVIIFLIKVTAAGEVFEVELLCSFTFEVVEFCLGVVMKGSSDVLVVRGIGEVLFASCLV